MVSGIGFGIGERQLQSIAESVAGELSSSFSQGSQTFIRTPLLYADGSSVVVRMDQGATDYFVTDYGFGSRSAHLAGADYWFRRYGEVQASLAGIQFDSDEFFTLRVGREQLAVAVATVANVSKTTLDIALLKLSEHRHAEDRQTLTRKLNSVFGSSHVAAEAEIAGASNHKWRVDALVSLEGRKAIFELVKPVPQSIFPAVAKFVDLNDLALGYRNVAVLDGRPREIELVNLLSRSARVISKSDSEDIYRAAA